MGTRARTSFPARTATQLNPVEALHYDAKQRKDDSTLAGKLNGFATIK